MFVLCASLSESFCGCIDQGTQASDAHDVGDDLGVVVRILLSFSVATHGTQPFD